MLIQNEPIKDIKKSPAVDIEKLIKETQQMKNELKKNRTPRLHYIFTLTIDERFFLDYGSIEGWKNFIDIYTSIFRNISLCKITQCNKINSLQFIIHEIVKRSGTSQMCRCSFEGIEFDVFTNGKDFEVVLDSNNSVLGLKYPENDFEKLNTFFERWASKVFIKSLKMEKYFDRSSINNIDIYESKYDSVLNLGHHSFIVYTYPVEMDIPKLIESPAKQLSNKMWINNGAFIPETRNSNRAFDNCIVHINGQDPSEYSGQINDCLRVLYHHMKYWSNIYIITNFMVWMASFSDLIEKDRIQVTKKEILNGLFFGKQRKHDNMISIKKMRHSLHDFIYFALNFNHMGLEEDMADDYDLMDFMGKYITLFQGTPLYPMKLFANYTEGKEKKLLTEFNQIRLDFQKRIEDFMKTTRDLETSYFQEYQLRLVEKTQELTLLSIIIVILIFILSKILPYFFLIISGGQ